MCFRSFPLLTIAIVLLISSCQPKPNVSDIDYSILGEYVTAYVPSEIEVTEQVRIVFAQAVADTTIDPKSVLKISPAVQGEYKWIGDKEIRFVPSGLLDAGTDYVATLELAQLYPDVPDGIRQVNFDMKTRELVITNTIERTVNIEGKRDEMEISGAIKSNMATDSKWIESRFSVEHTHDINVKWTHAKNGKYHAYTLSPVKRGKKNTQLKIKFEDDSNSKNNANASVTIPQIGKFAFTRYDRSDNGQQNITLVFSEKLDTRQNIDGLISMEDYGGKLKLSIIGNQIKVMPESKVKGSKKIKVSKSIASIFGNALKENVVVSVTFEEAKPLVKLLGKGVIVPDANKVIVPFEAIGLDAVDVEIFKIYSDNMLQFLENNTINDQGYNLQSVGHLVYQDKVLLRSLGSEFDQDQLQRYALEVSTLTNLEKSALYQINIGYRKAYTVYASENDITTIGQKDDYGRYTSFMNYRYYNYSRRNNPAQKDYYNADRFVSRSLLSTNIGITAKMGKNKKLHISTLDIMNAEPMSGVEINVYTQQKQIDQVAYTAKNGMVTIDVNQKPMYIVAKQDGMASYINLNDYRANSLTDFNIDGKNKKKGIDGYIYGERGVWRPGDTIHLTFVLDDRQNTLPINHPITIDVFDTKGTKKFSRTTTQHIDHMYTFSVPTGSSDPTGKWKTTVTVGGQKFGKNLRVETVKPNRIKMTYPNIKDVVNIHGNQKLELEADWLHGANASNLNAKVEMRLSAVDTKFDEYGSFEFDDPARKISSISTQIFEGKLDSDGKASIPIKSNKDLLAPGRLKVSLKTKVFEKSGNFSEDNLNVNANLYESYVGVKVPTTRWGSRKIDIDKNQPIEMIAVDADGEPMKNRKLKIGLYNARWSWWYNRRDNNLYTYNTAQHLGAMDTITLTTDTRGRASWKTDISQYGSHMVRVCDEVSGHCTGQFFYAGQSWHREQGSNNEGASLRFVTDQETYEVGEKMEVTLPSSKGAKVLVSIENNSDVVEEYWVDTDDKETTIDISVTEEMTPNVYVHLSMIQSYTNRKNDLPLRVYGVKSIEIDNPDAKLNPEISTANQYTPKENCTVKVSESDGKPMAYTLAVVDEGLLDLTRYKTPELYDHFFTKQSLGVKTWDIYDHVLNGYGADIERIISIGGDGEIAKEAATAKANRFVPVVHFSGPHYAAAGEQKIHNLSMPNYVGAVKVMVVARSNKAYGSIDKSIPVRSDLMVLPTLPRVLAPGEQLSLPVSVFSMNDKIENVKVTLESSTNIQLLDGDTKRLKYDGQGDQIASFDFKVGDQIGVEKFKVIATSGSYRAEQEIEIDVRNPNPFETKFDESILEKGKRWAHNFNSFGTKGTNTGSLELSTIPAINLEQRLGYLMRYPYGCVEQTTSSVFPQLYLDKFVDLDDVKKKQLDRNVRSGIERLRSFQLVSGGLSYWPGRSDANEWGTSYAGHFLIEASNLGYHIPSGMLDRWTKYQTKVSSSYNGDYHFVQAYRLYTLSLIGQPNWSAMNRLKSKSDISAATMTLLAAAYQIGGQESVAKALVNNIKSGIDYKPHPQGYYYGSITRNKALIAQAMLHISKNGDAAKLIQEIAKNMGSSSWYSTQTTAMALLAVSKYLDGKQASGLEYEISISGSSPVRGSTDKTLVTIPVDVEKLISGEIEVKNLSSQTLFARWIQQGKPKMDQWKSESENLSMKTKYTTMEGAPLDITSIKVGTDFIVQTTVTNPATRKSNVRDIALHQVFPSGWEIQNDRISGAQTIVKNDQYDYRDIRDVRVYTFFNLNGRSSKTFRTVLTATYPGQYYMPDNKCEAMYDKEIRAREAGQIVNVIK